MPAGKAYEIASLQEAVRIGRLADLGLLAVGEIYFCKDGADINHGKFVSSIPSGRVVNTLAAGVAKLRALQDDYLIVCPKPAQAFWGVAGAKQTISGDRLHVVGAGRYGDRPKLPSLNFTGHFSELRNVHVLSSDPTALEVIVTGSDATPSQGQLLSDCVLELADGNAIGDSIVKDYTTDSLIRNCEFRYLGTALAGVSAFIQEKAVGSTKIEDCLFLLYASEVGSTFGNSAGNGLASTTFFKNCIMHQLNEAVTLTEAFNVFDSGKVYATDTTITRAAIFCATAARSWVAPVGMPLGTVGSLLLNPYLAKAGDSPIAA